MAVIRVNKTKDYTVMSNIHLKEKDMSLKAKGLLSLMLSLPEDWDYSITGLVALCKENESAIKSTLGELKYFGYLIVTKKMPNETESGRIEYEYDIYEQPHLKQALENLSVEYQQVENQGQLNTNNKDTKKLNTKYKKERKKEISKSQNSFDEIFKSYTQNEETLRLLGEWLKVRKAKRAAMTDYSIRLNLNKLETLAKQSNLSVNNYLKEVIARGWQAFYPIKNFETESNKQSNDKTYSGYRNL